MHENKAEFYIQNYIKYSDKTKKLMGGLGAVCKLQVFLESSISIKVNCF